MIRSAIFLGLVLMVTGLSAEDLDKDGLDDDFEQQLLEQFRPVFVISAKDCDALPASFQSGKADPVLQRRDGTIYGQAFQTPGGRIELHYFHLWNKDCGRSGHPLDIEHVSVRLESAQHGWRATHWFASAHQNTACDLGQGATASLLRTDDHGITVWVSHGKHASFLSQEACRKGCGGDRCEDPMRPLPDGPLINLGEAGAPLNGATWTASKQWDFVPKLATDFDEFALARIDEARKSVAYFKPTLVPVRATVRGLNEGVDGVSTADQHTTRALDKSFDSTKGALDKSYDSTKGALKKAADATSGFLGIGKKKQP